MYHGVRSRIIKKIYATQAEITETESLIEPSK